jgi:hypothetical protein
LIKCRSKVTAVRVTRALTRAPGKLARDRDRPFACSQSRKSGTCMSTCRLCQFTRQVNDQLLSSLIQRPKMCARSGSAVRLNADSHPTGGFASVVTAGDDAFEVGLGKSDNRSPLWVRSTETTSAGDQVQAAAKAQRTCRLAGVAQFSKKSRNRVGGVRYSAISPRCCAAKMDGSSTHRELNSEALCIQMRYA